LPDELNVSQRLACLNSSMQSPADLERLAGDASTRVYYRARYADGRTAMLMLQACAGCNEEAAFLDIQRFLEHLGLPVPKVLAHYPDQGAVVLEDLGDELLETVIRNAREDELREYYSSAVDLLVELRHKTDGLTAGCGAFALAFDEEKLMQEMHFFVTHFVRGFCGRELDITAQSELESFFILVCRALAAEPRVFAHRDYHSRNLMLHLGRLVMIDFQDARMGPAQYDLSSLLRDSYVALPGDLVEVLLQRYQEGTEVPEAARDRFRRVFDLMCLQRNIKALGTFGFQTVVRQTSRYLSAIPRTGAYIARNMMVHSELNRFRSVLEDFITGPALAVRHREE
jgi:N-acetylmuramate 1-kinase